MGYAVDVNCESGHGFSIDPLGVNAKTDIICPTCGNVQRIGGEAAKRFLETWRLSELMKAKALDSASAQAVEDALERDSMAAEPLRVARVVHDS